MSPLTKAVIRRAAAELNAYAEGIRHAHTIPGGGWGAHSLDQAGKEEYELVKRLVAQLRKAA